jgi:hypothetical protein
MNQQQIVEELMSLLEAGGVTLRHEPLGGRGGGLCNIKGRTIVFVDTEATMADTGSICAEAVAKSIDIETVYIRPEVRAYIEEYAEYKRN